MMIKKKYYGLLVIIMLFSIFLITIKVYCGGVCDSLGSDALNNAKLLYNYLTSSGYTPQAACGILGNVDQESVFDSANNTDSGGHHGFFQMSTDQWNTFKTWASEANQDYTDIRVQMHFVEECGMPDSTVSHYSSLSGLSEFKSITNTRKATEAFCMIYERCTGGDAVEFTELFSSVTSGNTYQELDLRKTFAESFETSSDFANLEASEPASSSTSSDSTTSTIVSIDGTYYTQDELGAWVKLSELNVDEKYIEAFNRDSLDQNSISSLVNWERNIEMSNMNNGFIAIMRRISMWLGIILIIWALFLYIAFWFDRLNTVFDFDTFGILTFGKLTVSPDDNESTFHITGDSTAKKKTVNHKNVVFICTTAVLFGVLLISGVFYTLLRKFVNFIYSKLYI